MPEYRVYYLKDRQTLSFRESPPKEKPYRLRFRDYEEGPLVTSPGPYALWKKLQEDDTAPPASRKFGVGDALETDGHLIILNYWGFDDAHWQAVNEPGAAEGEFAEQLASQGA